MAATDAEAGRTARLQHLRRNLRAVISAHRSKENWRRTFYGEGLNAELRFEGDRALLAKEIASARQAMHAASPARLTASIVKKIGG